MRVQSNFRMRFQLYFERSGEGCFVAPRSSLFLWFPLTYRFLRSPDFSADSARSAPVPLRSCCNQYHVPNGTLRIFNGFARRLDNKSTRLVMFDLADFANRYRQTSFYYTSEVWTADCRWTVLDNSLDWPCVANSARSPLRSSSATSRSTLRSFFRLPLTAPLRSSDFSARSTPFSAPLTCSGFSSVISCITGSYRHCHRDCSINYFVGRHWTDCVQPFVLHMCIHSCCSHTVPSCASTGNCVILLVHGAVLGHFQLSVPFLWFY